MWIDIKPLERNIPNSLKCERSLNSILIHESSQFTFEQTRHNSKVKFYIVLHNKDRHNARYITDV